MDQGVDGWDRAGEVAAQGAAAHLSRGGGSRESGVAHAMGHCFRWGLTLRMQRIQGNSPRGSSNGGGDQSRARDGGQLAATFDEVDDEFQRSVGDEI
jgi:hypothetical protein